MRFTVIILALLVLFMLAGVLPAPGGAQTAVFTTPVFVILMGLLAVASLGCCWKQGLAWRKVPFGILHLGVVVLLVGAFIGFMGGGKAVLELPLYGGRALWEWGGGGGAEPLRPGFGVSASDFKVEYYAQKPDASARGGAQVIPRHYSAKLRFMDETGATQESALAVNHPAGYRGWRFYLMSYDRQAMSAIIVLAKRDPGQVWVLAGIWMVILGTFGVCFMRQGGGNAVS